MSAEGTADPVLFRLTRYCLMEEEWIRRRAETIEFIDLTTTVRTIEYELLPGKTGGMRILPFGTYVRGQGRGEFKVTDQEGKVLRFLTAKESKAKVLGMTRLLLGGTNLQDAEAVCGHIEAMLSCDAHGYCERCRTEYGRSRVFRDPDEIEIRQRVEKRKLELGCRSMWFALKGLGLDSAENDESKELLARLILDVRESYVLFVEVDQDGPTHVRVRFDEELQNWDRPGDVYKGIKPECVAGDLDEAVRTRESGSGREQGHESQVQPDLKHSADRWRRPWRLFMAGGFTPWHVGFDNHASPRIESSHLNVKVPPELVVSKMRCLGSVVKDDVEPGREESWDALEPRLETADELGPRAHLHYRWGKQEIRPGGLPSFVSILIAPNSGALWVRGAILGVLTGLLLMMIGFNGVTDTDVEREAIVTILVLIPGLLGTLVAIDAESEIGTRLIRNAQILVATISGLSLLAAAAIAFWEPKDAVACAIGAGGVAALAIGVYLAAVRIYFRKVLCAAPMRERSEALDESRERLKSFPPSKMWLLSGEGDRDVPYGWIIEELDALDGRDNRECAPDRSQVLANRSWPKRPPRKTYGGIRWAWLSYEETLQEREEIGKLAWELRKIQIKREREWSRRVGSSP